MSEDFWQVEKPHDYSTKEWAMFQCLSPKSVEEKLKAEGWTQTNEVPPWLQGNDVALLVRESGQRLLVVHECHPDWQSRMIELVDYFAKAQDLSRLEALAFLTGRRALVMDGDLAMMDKYRAQGIADDVSRSVKCAAAAKIREVLAERNIELPDEKMEVLLTKLGDLAYSELWQGLAEESDRPTA